jgi:hypothetical protein
MRGPSPQIFAFTNSANRTVINSAIASSRNCEGVSCCQAEAPAHATPTGRWGFCFPTLPQTCALRWGNHVCAMVVQNVMAITDVSSWF